MRRLGWSIAIVFASGCSGGSAFQCAENGQCTLAGVEGICTESGNCAYPDAECLSGYRFPAGAPNGLAGLCTDDPLAEGSAGVGSWEGGGSNSGVGDATSNVDSMGPDAGPGAGAGTSNSTTGAGTASGADTSGPACAQEDSEFNNEPNDAGLLTPTGCAVTTQAAIGGSDGTDYFDPGFDPSCYAAGSLVFDIDPLTTVRRCLRITCDPGMSPDILCMGCNLSGNGVVWEACGNNDFEVTVDCPGISVLLFVEYDDECTDYNLEFAPPV